jgi:hypothetical protein
MKRTLRLLEVVLLLLVLLYAGDYVSVRYGIPNHRNPFGVIRVDQYYAVPLKNGRIEYMLADPIDQTCVNSLFPHLGYVPCWYLSRHRQKRIDVGMAPNPIQLAKSTGAGAPERSR